ncbi:MAG: sigma-70 family RNA polymerase sigma factor [Mariprofundaceae bacterium]
MIKSSDLESTATTWLHDHGDTLYRFAMLKLGNEEQARDAVQEALLGAWKNRSRFRGESSIRTWLISILKHKITDSIRKSIRNRELIEQAEHDPTSGYFNKQGAWSDSPKLWPDSPEKLYHDAEFLTVLTQCLSKLPPMQREVFALREISGEDSTTICNSCDISPTNFHVLMHRARTALRLCLDHHWFGKG